MSSRNPAADNDPVDDADDRSGLDGVGDDGVAADNGSADVETGGDTGGRTRTRDERPGVKRGTGARSARDDASGRSAGAAAATAASIPAIVLDAIRNLLARPLASYQLILTMSFLLTTFGLVMVLSASSVEGYSKEGSAYGLFATQVIFALLGLVVFYFMLRIPVRLLRRFAAPAMFVAVVLLALVLIPGVGTLSQGARRWFVIYGLSVQPSELVKVALCIWGAHLLASRRRDNALLRELLVPLVPVAMLVCLLIILEPNLSTTITIAIIVGALLWFAGLPVKVFVSFAVSGIALAVILALAEGYRSQRVMSFLGNVDDPQGAGYQARQATYALANGGVFGVGLGQSSAKWNYLPNAHNDFIFAIIGEELGLLGGLMVVFLFVVLAYIGFRIASRSTDPFLRLMSATITVLITAQAFINIGYVIGLLPVTGIQLPLISAGGTSTLTVLAMLGLLANAARHEPEAVATLTGGSPSRVARWLRLPTPVAYRQTRAESLRDRLDQRRTAGPRPTAGAGRGGRGPQSRRRPPSGPAPSADAGRGRRRFPLPWRRAAETSQRRAAPSSQSARDDRRQGRSSTRSGAGDTRGARSAASGRAGVPRGRVRPGTSSRSGVDYGVGYRGSGSYVRGAGSGASGPYVRGAGSGASGPNVRGAGRR
ncbi:putative lipid II flippase FtsW [Gordonia sp. NPDC057258]|uniref:putative lipid II flippase FtsW n=1 Tax=unclassified Gordonia (in: high G+C Gram-positive bacteria) TaxID=2657482 RepID=UPI003640ABD8